MLKTSKFILLGSLVCAFGYTFWIVKQHSPGHTDAVKTIETAVRGHKQYDAKKTSDRDELASLVNRLQLQINSLQQQLNEQRIAINTLHTSLTAQQQDLFQQQPSDTTENSIADSVTEQSEKQLNILDTTLANEVIDRKWSDQAVNTMLDIFDQVLPVGTDITQLDCQSTLCKIGLDHSEGTELDDFLDKFMFKLGWQTNSFIHTSDTADGHKTTVVYLSRDGYYLPDIWLN